MMSGWMRIKEVEKYASVSRSTVDKWRANGLKTYNVSGVRLIKTADVDEYIEIHSVVEVPDVMAKLTVVAKGGRR